MDLPAGPGVGSAAGWDGRNSRRQFIGAQAARAGTIGLVVASSIAAAPSAPLIVAGGVTGEFLTGMLIVAGEARKIHHAQKN